jgi:hypothetical protein
MLAPKTNTKPPTGPRLCCNLKVDVVESMDDIVPNQSLFSNNSLAYWAQWGTVITVWDSDSIIGHGPAGLVPNPTKKVPSLPQYAEWSKGTRRYLGDKNRMKTRVEYNWVLTGVFYDATTWVREQMTKGGANYVGDNGYAFVCHSQGCNILMHILNRVCKHSRTKMPQ